VPPGTIRRASRAWPALVVVCLVAAGAAAAPERFEAAEQAREIVANGRYQTELPEPTGLEEGFGWLGRLAALSPVARLAIAAVAAAVIALLVLWISIEARRWRRVGREARREAADDGLGPELDGDDVGDAARLAQAGRYGEAIHLLLLLAIRRLSRHARVPPAHSRTSRELGRLLPLEGPARSAFRELVLAVEVSHFGGVDAGPDDWAACRSHFRTATGERA
jgi:hypothetical protein